MKFNNLSDYVLAFQSLALVPKNHSSPYVLRENFSKQVSPLDRNPLPQQTGPYASNCSSQQTRLFFLHVNIRSLNKNIRKMKDLIELLPVLPDVICVSEVRCPKSKNIINLGDYKFYIRRTKEQGGVAIYVKKK